METKAPAISAVPDPGSVQVQPTAQAAPRAEAKADQEKAAAKVVVAEPDQVSVRLVIEMDKASGTYVYKTINNLTGELVSQLPRAEVLRLKEQPGYAAGSVIRTKA